MDREWFRDESRKRDGLPPKNDSGSGNGTRRPNKAHWSTTPEDVAKANNVPPAHAVLAARYEMAIRARTKKTFALGFICGAATCGIALALFYL
jgi:hypothetical protein